MNVFISWSGNVSQQVAIALRKWLPYFLQSIKPFVSSVDIRAGERWSDEISQRLKEAEFGIVCVTPFNMHKAWMNFESGALASLPNLSPFLFRVDRAALAESPLTQFQLVEFSPDADFSRAEFLKLIREINRNIAEPGRLTDDVLAKTFETWWPSLKQDLDAVPRTSPSETRTAYKWLRTFEDLAIHDLAPNCNAVWFVTSDVFKYAMSRGVRDRIEANLEKKVGYRYLIPEPDGSDERAARDQLAALALTYPGQLDFRCFKRDVFEKQAISDYIIIVEARAGENDHIRVFVRIPLGAREAEYWFETEERAAIGFYNRFSQLWSSRADQAPAPLVVAEVTTVVAPAVETGVVQH